MVSEIENKKLDKLERRISQVELIAHPPRDWDKLHLLLERKIESLERAYGRLYDLMVELIKER
mgnify:CR=1 FL=1